MLKEERATKIQYKKMQVRGNILGRTNNNYNSQLFCFCSVIVYFWKRDSKGKEIFFFLNAQKVFLYTNNKIEYNNDFISVDKKEFALFVGFFEVFLFVYLNMKKGRNLER